MDVGGVLSGIEAELVIIHSPVQLEVGIRNHNRWDIVDFQELCQTNTMIQPDTDLEPKEKKKKISKEHLIME